MSSAMLIVCIDGFGPDYPAASDMPNLKALAGQGVWVVGHSVVPSVTNVNNASLITGRPPVEHGITANYWLDRATGLETYMESAADLERPTILSRAAEKGLKTALLTSKKKLLGLLDAGAGYSLSAENPDREMTDAVGPPPDIYSAGVNIWLFKALRRLLAVSAPDLIYCSTTDGMMHRHGPEEEESQAHLAAIDRELGRIMNDNPDLEIRLTADHGMNAKSRGLDLDRALAGAGLSGRAVPIIKDRYTVHHSNLGGSSYIHLASPELTAEAVGVLSGLEGVEEVLTRKEAAGRFSLRADRLGELMVLGDERTVFGTFDEIRTEVAVRSHGSVHESRVPIIANRPLDPGRLVHNHNLTAEL